MDYFKLSFFKGYAIRIYKPLFLIKVALFFWFAGGIATQTFFPVFLKQRGVSIAQMSLATTVSTVLQLICSLIAGVVADKIGRTKPILFILLAIIVALCVAFFIMPPLDTDAAKHHFYFQDSNIDSTHKSTFEPICNFSATYNEPKCKLYYNSSQMFSKDHCFKSDIVEEKMLSQIAIINNRTIAFKKIEICLLGSNEIMSSNYSYKICNGNYCNYLLHECKSRFGECSNRDNSTVVLFLAYALLTAIYFTSLTLTFRFFDDTVITLTSEHNSDFGRQRVWSNIGSLVGPTLAGYVMQWASGNDRNYSLVFVFYGSFTLLSALASWKLVMPKRNPGKRMWRKFIALLKNPDILTFMLVVLVLGTSYSYIILYSNWFLEDLGASKVFLGLLTPVSSTFAFVTLLTSKWWYRNVGAENIFVIALVGYAFYFVYLSFLIEPWYAILGRIVAFTFSYHLLWVTVVEFSHILAPEGLHATVIVSIGVFHFLVGKGTASLLGGTLISAYGGRIAFRVMGGINLFTAILYTCFHYSRRCYQK
ncbi:hypothetical protein JTE90_004817 [Oedothorax gibbosus]|uniref:Major facilitator superfamily associated domain-containing protein n=1 Tax=Oedothorax gibbosus TaxID=931172 RepID=A0AAV6VGL3_9ARAC|nr:hypothetical protein JTE90_004817 [Oedothorax gibbosus]